MIKKSTKAVEKNILFLCSHSQQNFFNKEHTMKRYLVALAALCLLSGYKVKVKAVPVPGVSGFKRSVEDQDDMRNNGEFGVWLIFWNGLVETKESSVEI
jgi:hypothetical protein